jgi:hypothetical protein
MEFNLRIQRAGGVILLDPSIVCDYFSRPTLAGFWRHNFRNGVWAVLPFAFSHYVPVRARHLIPFVFVCLLTMSLFLPFPWFFAVAATYAGANLAASAHLAFVERKLSQFFLLPIVFASLHLAYGLGSAWGLLKVLALKLDFKGAPKRASRLET